ncbi:MAG: carboxypeptidase-like regulatory domain-containing protein [Flavobacteriales bacterium]
MRNKILYILLFAFTFACSSASAQKEKKIIQLTGIVISKDSLQPVPFTNILVKGTSRGTISDFSGYFSLVVATGDTLKFSSIGFVTEYYVIPDTLSQSSYSLIQTIGKKIINIEITRWPSYEQFKFAFENMEIPEGDMENAKRNLNRMEVDNSVEYRADANLNYKWQQEDYKSKLYYAGQLPPNNLLNPIAWAKFLKAWRNGELKIER